MAVAGHAVCRRYAKALFGLAREADAIEAVRRELDGLMELLEANEALREVILRPFHPAAERAAVLTKLGARLRLSPLLVNFCRYLIDRRRTTDLAGIREEYDRLADEAAGRLRGEVLAAAPLATAQRDRLRRALAARTGREVAFDVRVDPELLGGVIARVGDVVFDGSLRTQLTRMRASLAKER